MKKVFLKFFGGAMLIVLIASSCKKTTDVALPPIGGFNNSGEVGKSDLIAYWPLNGDGNESISGTTPSKTLAVTFETGVKGKGATFNSGYMDYPSIPALVIADGSISISCWAKITNTKASEGAVSTISPLLSFSGGPNKNVGNLSLFGNTHGLVTSDSIQLKGEFHFKKSDGTEFGGDCINMIKKESWMDSTHTWNANKIGGVWAHVVYVYDGTNAKNRLYVNGVKISNSAWESRNGGLPLPMSFFTPSRPIIGALATVVDGTNADTWNAALKGSVDEIRVWKKALAAAEIDALYQLEKAGR